MLALAATISCRETENIKPALDLSNLDQTVAPGEDFYRYATGGWMKSHPLRPEYARYGTMNVLTENNEKQLKQLFENLSAGNPVPGSDAQKIDDLYNMGLDSTRLAAEGAEPLKSGLEAINAISDSRSFAETVARLHASAVFPLFLTFL